MDELTEQDKDMNATRPYELNGNEAGMPESQEQLSHLQFQMWDKHLTVLNKIWDLQEWSQQAETKFHTTLWDQHLLQLNQSWALSATIATPPPKSFLAKLLSPMRKLVLRWVQPLIDGVVQQQNAVTAQLVQTCNTLVKAVNEEAISRLEAQQEFNAKLVRAMNDLVELLAFEFKRVRREFEQTEETIWTFDRRKEALEIDQVMLNRKVEQVIEIVKHQAQYFSSSVDAYLPAQERQEDYAYFLFENLYRGDEAVIKQRHAKYLPYFQECTNVLDMGCGRGEFLELLKEHGITGYGVDVNQTMLEVCRTKDLRVAEHDILSHLQSLDDNSVDGIFTSHTVEHCSPQELYQLFHLCYAKLQPQKYFVIETQNPTSLYALSHFHRDMSHDKPVHPDALTHLLKMLGFQDAYIEYNAPFPEEHQLQELTALEAMGGISDALCANVEVLNQNIRQLNGLLYGYLDYAVIAQKIRL